MPMCFPLAWSAQLNARKNKNALIIIKLCFTDRASEIPIERALKRHVKKNKCKNKIVKSW